MGKVKRVNILHATLYLGMGGLETVIMDLCRHTDKSKYNIHVLCLCQYDEKYRAQLKSDGTEVHFINKKSKFDLSFFTRIISLLKTRNIQAIHAHSGCFFNMAVCSYLAKVPVRIFTEHGLPLDNEGKSLNLSMKARCEDIITGAIATDIYGVSDEIVMNLSSRMLGQKKKIRHAVNGINTACFTPEMNREMIDKVKQKLKLPTQKLIIGSVGRLEKIKNHALLLNACEQLKIRNIDFHVVLVGDGACRHDLLSLAKALGIENSVTFAGVQYQIENILPVFDIFVLPSQTEGTSISLLEAMSCGIPCIASNVGGTPTIIDHGHNGLLFDSDNVGDLVEKLLTLFDNRGFRETLSHNAVHTVEESFSLVKMVGQYESAYNNTVTGN